MRYCSALSAACGEQPCRLKRLQRLANLSGPLLITLQVLGDERASSTANGAAALTDQRRLLAAEQTLQFRQDNHLAQLRVPRPSFPAPRNPRANWCWRKAIFDVALDLRRHPGLRPVVGAELSAGTTTLGAGGLCPWLYLSDGPRCNTRPAVSGTATAALPALMIALAIACPQRAGVQEHCWPPRMQALR